MHPTLGCPPDAPAPRQQSSVVGWNGISETCRRLVGSNLSMTLWQNHRALPILAKRNLAKLFYQVWPTPNLSFEGRLGGRFGLRVGGEGGSQKGEGPEGRGRSENGKMEPEGWGPSGWGSKGGGAKNFASRGLLLVERPAEGPKVCVLGFGVLVFASVQVLNSGVEVFRVNDIREGQRGDRGVRPKMAKIHCGVKPDMVVAATVKCLRLVTSW